MNSMALFFVVVEGVVTLTFHEHSRGTERLNGNWDDLNVNSFFTSDNGTRTFPSHKSAQSQQLLYQRRISRLFSLITDTL